MTLEEIKKIHFNLPSTLLNAFHAREDKDLIYEAFYDFFPDERVEFNPEDPLFILFMSWYLFQWNQDKSSDLNAATYFLAHDLGNATERKLVESGVMTSFMFFEIAETIPDKGVFCVDLLSKEKIFVSDMSTSKALKKGQVIFAKLIACDDYFFFDALGPFPISIENRFVVCKRMLEWEEEYGKCSFKKMPSDLQFELIDFYVDYYLEMTNGAAARIVNTEGEEIEPHELTFLVSSFDLALSKLSVLNHMETLDQLIQGAKKSSSGESVEVIFPWLSKTKKNQGPVVIAHLELKEKTLIVRVNSRQRAEKFLKRIGKLMPKGSFELKSRVVSDLKDLATSSHQESVTEMETLSEEMLRILEQKYRDSYSSWEHQKIPALDNKRPIDLVKTKKGRLLVDALISDFELMLSLKPLPGMSQAIFNELRARLGLSEKRH